MVAQYTDLISGEDLESINKIPDGEGAIISRNLKKFAVYKDENGILHSYSAICPHLGCVVQWNTDEKSFDCPCHGSRFTCHGQVINGPANTDLKKIDLKEKANL
jgi:Rieske Fe-S protein